MERTTFQQQCYRLFLIFAGLCVGSCTDTATSSESSRIPEVPILNYQHVAAYPHDQEAFTEGLLFHEGRLYESTGATDLPQTRSLFGEVDLSTGVIDVKVELDRETYFGEGITFLNGQVYQLTYQSRQGFVYDALTFERIREFKIPSKEGWGMTTDGTHLIMSDGSHQLTYIDPNTLEVTKKLNVKEGYYNKKQLNELEYVAGMIYANVWMTSEVVKIDPQTGRAVGKLDLSSYASDAKSIFPDAMEMNGIAYHPGKQTFFITGKLWPKIYEIRIGE